MINPFGVGDILFSTPLLSVVKEKHPVSYIGYICNIRTREILETNPEINEIFVFERDEYRALWRYSKIKCIRRLSCFWNEIRKRRFDEVIDLSLGKEYAFFCWLAGIKERRGFDYKGRGRFLTHKVHFDGFNDKPVAEYYLDLLGIKKQGGMHAVLVPDHNDIAYIDDFLEKFGLGQKDLLVGIAPGGGISFGKKDQGRRQWGAARFSELSDRIVERFNARMVLIWGPGEKHLVEKIAGGMKKNSLIAPKTTIRQMAALCKRCRIVICSEGGPLHIASSQGVSTVSIFGPVDEKVYGPYPSNENNIVIASDIECRPCYKRFKLSECETKKCLEDISVNTVYSAITKKLEKTVND
jgi:heptosyltransferase-2